MMVSKTGSELNKLKTDFLETESRCSMYAHQLMEAREAIKVLQDEKAQADFLFAELN